MVVSRMQCAITIYIVFLVDFSVSNAVIYSRHVRQAATTEAAIVGTTPKEQPECHNFQLQMGISFRNYHSCCELDAASTTTGAISRPPACATTFSDKDQVFNCKPTKRSYLEPNITTVFHCAGCLGQTWAKDKCSSRWFWLGKKSTVSCWVMSECFKRACQSQEEQLQIGNEIPIEISFCGDGLCEDDKNETKHTCPLDCCSVENPRKCAISDNKCPDICCSEEHCCDITANSLIDADKFWLVIALIFVGVIVFINVLCCCCCYCLYDKCGKVIKRRRRMKALRSDSKRSSVKDTGIEYVNSTRPISSSNL